MKHRDTSSQEQSSDFHDDLIQAIQTAQQAIHQHNTATPEHREACATIVRECLYVLWMLLAEPLMRVAAGWTTSGPYEDLIRTRTRRDALEGLAMNMFLNIIEALPLLRIDPERNVLGLLMIIARRGASKEHKKVYQRTPRKSGDSTKEEHLVPGTPAAAMAPPYELVSGVMGVLDSETHEQLEPVDPASTAFEEQLLWAIHAEQCWQVLRDDWFPTLSPENWLILHARWFNDPPLPFEEITTMLGAGWTLPAVRKRLSRILKAAAAFLHDRGFLE